MIYRKCGYDWKVPEILPMVFALTQGLANPIQMLDLSSEQGITTYNLEISSLTIPFDGNSKDINLFKTKFKEGK